MELSKEDEEIEEIEVSPENQFDPEDLNIPLSTQVLSMEEFFGSKVVEPEDIQIKVREMLVPMALSTYKSLLSSGDLKVRKSADRKSVV